MSEVIARSRSVRNRISSRRQTMLTARRSCRRPCSGTATRISATSFASMSALVAASVSRVTMLSASPVANAAPSGACASVPDASASRMVLPV